eukprot:9957624-Ditylum_brightwellii.AAC.1
MPTLKKTSSAIAHRWCSPSLHFKTTKKLEEITPNKGKGLLLQVPHDVSLQATTPALIATTETSTLHHGDDMPPFLDCSLNAIPRTAENYSDDDDGKMPALTDHNRDANEDLGEDEDGTIENITRKIITKANEKHQCQIIAYLYQE